LVSSSAAKEAALIDSSTIIDSKAFFMVPRGDIFKIVAQDFLGAWPPIVNQEPTMPAPACDIFGWLSVGSSPFRFTHAAVLLPIPFACQDPMQSSLFDSSFEEIP
jgi:hypothetical protein